MIMIIIVVAVMLILLWVISIYNKFIKLQNKVEEASSAMDIYPKKRYDLIPNLVETVKGYTKYELEALGRVISARDPAVNTQSLDEGIRPEKNFQSMPGPLYVISERYPDLKADQHFIQPQNELRGIESEIANSHKYYNAACVKSNNLVEMFPSNLLVDILRKTKKPLCEIEDAARRKSVEIQF